jgi:hypothetical protein
MVWEIGLEKNIRHAKIEAVAARRTAKTAIIIFCV